MTVAVERDRLAPAAEEARWRARQLERQLTDSQAAAETAQAVRACARDANNFEPIEIASVTLCSMNKSWPMCKRCVHCITSRDQDLTTQNLR